MLEYKLQVFCFVFFTVLKKLTRKRRRVKIIFKLSSKRTKGASHEDIEGRMDQVEAIVGAEAPRQRVSWFLEIPGDEVKGCRESVQVPFVQ